jgi:transposase InsO family protein
MELRMRLVNALIAEEDSVAAVCEEYGVSRKTGYKWLSRFRAQGPAGLAERSHAPHVVPWAMTQAQTAVIVALRRQHPSWGPKKLRAKLLARAPEQPWPGLSTIGDLLQRSGLSQRRKRRRRATPTPSGVPAIVAPNDVWCIDFKGWFRTGDGVIGYPLTVTDAFSRYLLCCRGLVADYEGCRRELERLFRQYGLPRFLLSNNGPPFASLASGGLSRLSVWWIKLGITPVRIKPGKPQQNGRHERMHKTLKAETAQPPAATLADQQHASLSSGPSLITSAHTKH